MSRKPDTKRYTVSNAGFAWAVHDRAQEKTYYEGVDPSEQSGPKGRIVAICPNAETAHRIANELNAADAKKTGA